MVDPGAAVPASKTPVKVVNDNAVASTIPVADDAEGLPATSVCEIETV